MGSSFVEKAGCGFWVSDSLLEIWLLALVREIDAAHEPAPWLIQARDYWYQQATIGLQGCIYPDLDRFSASEDQRRELITLSEQARQRLLDKDQSFDLPVSSWLGFGLSDTTLNAFLAQLPEVGHLNLSKTARHFIALLRGEVTSGVSDVESISWFDQ